MLKYLIQVIQHSLTLAILAALLCAAFYRRGGAERGKWLEASFGVGIFAALAVAFLKTTTVLINREYVNISVLSVSIPAGIWFILLLGGVFRRRRWYQRAFDGAWAFLNAALLFYSLTDIFLYPAEFVMAGQSAVSTDFLFKLIGYTGGVAVVCVVGGVLFQAGRRTALRLLQGLLTAGLLINLADQIASLVQLTMARRIIPVLPWLFKLIQPVINHHDAFLYALLAVTLPLPLVLWKRSRPAEPADININPAQRRKIIAASRQQRRWSVLIVTGYALAIFCLTAVKAYSSQEVVLSPAEPMRLVGEEIHISITGVEDGHLHRFVYTASDGTEVRFIVIKKTATAYGVGLDACDICGPTGYYERDGKVICKLCDVVMNVSTIGFKGGCNPVPLNYALSDGRMIIQTADLEQERKRFR